MEYKKNVNLTTSDIKELFLSVQWSSGHYPDRLKKALDHSGTVFTAWDGNQLVGLINALDDGEMTAYIHYLLVRPDYQKKGIGEHLLELMKKAYETYLRIVLISYDKEQGFYEKCGFKEGEDKVPMFLTSLWT